MNEATALLQMVCDFKMLLLKQLQNYTCVSFFAIIVHLTLIISTLVFILHTDILDMIYFLYSDICLQDVCLHMTI